MCELDINLFVSLNYLFYFTGSLPKLLANFFLTRINEEIIWIKCLSSQKNDGIFHIFYLIKVSRVKE